MPTTAMGGGVLQFRSCVDPEFYSGAKGSGAGGHEGPFIELVSVEIRSRRLAHRGQPERGWLSFEGGWLGAWGVPLYRTTLRLCPAHCSLCELCPPLPSPAPAATRCTALQALGSAPGPWNLLGEAICRRNCWQMGEQARNQHSASIHRRQARHHIPLSFTLSYLALE